MPNTAPAPDMLKHFVNWNNNDRRFWAVGEPIKVSGVLDGDAVVHIKTDGTVAVNVIIKQPGGLPIQVERCYGNGAHAQNHAHAEAANLKHGKRVRAVGHQLVLNYLLPTLSLELQACTGLELVPMAKDRQ